MITRKSPQEIERMRESCLIVSEVHRLLAPHCRPGIALSELDRMAEEYIRSRGGIPAFKGYPAHDRSVPPFPSTLCVSIDDEVVHGIPDGRVIREGEIISIDVGVEKNGYYGDGAMTIMVGEVDAVKRRLVEVTREALYRGLEAAGPGNHLGDL
ncbi:MAG: M24 family metallopeptidase, partial [Bacteroidota bacterium]|nr:M24 family metallopeptidase [Bacteroidota bacterium]